MIVSEETFGVMQIEMAKVLDAIEKRSFSEPEELEARAARALRLSSDMAEKYVYGPDDRGDRIAIEVDWEVYGLDWDDDTDEEGNQHDIDLYAAIALRQNSDKLLKKWGYDPDDPKVVAFCSVDHREACPPKLWE